MESDHIEELKMKSINSEKRLDSIEKILEQANEIDDNSGKSYSNLRSPPNAQSHPFTCITHHNTENADNTENIENIELGIKVSKASPHKPKTNKKMKFNDLSESSLVSSKSDEPKLDSSEESVE